MAGDRFLADKAAAWDSVVQALNYARPDWHSLAMRGVDAAVAAIRELGAAREARDTIATAPIPPTSNLRLSYDTWIKANCSLPRPIASYDNWYWTIFQAGAEAQLRAGETSCKPARDANHCDFPDCEQHWTLVVEMALEAMSKFHATFTLDEEDADLTPRTTSEAFRAFVDEHARLLRIRGSAPKTSREPTCDHDGMKTVNADGFCLVCGEPV